MRRTYRGYWLVTSMLLFLWSSSIQAQSYDLLPGTIAAEHFQNGQQAMLAGQYRQAIRHFEKAISHQPGLTIAKKMVGHCYDLLKDYTNAAENFRQVLNRDSLFSRLLYYQLGDIYYKMGRADVALHYFETFERLQQRPADDFGLRGEEEEAQELILRARLPGNLRACQLSLDSVKFINITEIHNAGPGINTRYDDYFPCLTNDQQRLYFTRKDAAGDEDLFTADRQPSGGWASPQRIRNFNTPQPEGMVTLVRDGRRLYYTSCLKEGIAGACDIWEALADGAEIRQTRSLVGPVNQGSWDSQAAISCDGSTIFFASNRAGGLGGSDIWMSELQADGQWGEPINLGVTINTPEDEEAPFISNDGKTLYFSSTGHLGLGEQDVFMSWWDERLDRWSVPINLGPPVNGPHRELGFHLSADGKTGFFASNRPGGAGGMDIYYFALSERLHGEPITFVEGFVKDSLLLTPLPGAVVEINGRNPVRADEEGRFFICAGADELLAFSVERDDYYPYHQAFLIPEWNNQAFYGLELLLLPTVSFIGHIDNPWVPAPTPGRRTDNILIHAVYFTFDSDELLAAEADSLQKLINDLSSKEVVHLEIIGYADDIGADAYNLSLSERRASVVAVYLLQRNIKVDQVHIEGRGPVREQGPKAKNRRVDIRITFKE